MSIGSTGDNAEAALRNPRCERLRVANHLADIGFEIIRRSFLEADGLCGYHMNEGSALHFRKDGSIEILGELFAAHDHSASRPAKRLMCGAGDEVRVRN